MNKIVLFITGLVLCSIISGCATNPPVVKSTNGIYTLFRQDLRGAFGDPYSFRADVMREAENMAQAAGGTLIPVSFTQTPVRPFGQWATIEFRFMILSPADLRARDKSIQIKVGDSPATITSMFGNPVDRQFRGTDEAWTYADTVGIDDYKYSVVWFHNGVVSGITTYRSSGAMEAGLRTIDWGAAPAGSSVSTPAPAPSRSQQTESGTILVSTGTGFLVGNDGFMLTNYHVIKGGNRIRVRLDGKDWDVQVISTDDSSDVALLKVDLTGPVTGLGIDLSPASLGESIYTIGYPNPGIQGVEPKYTSGEVSSLKGVTDDTRYLQVSVPVQPGNSGGALVTKDGLVIGIVSARLSDSVALDTSGALPQNVNYAVKISRALPLLLDAGVQKESTATQSEKPKRTIEQVSRATGLILVYN